MLKSVLFACMLSGLAGQAIAQHSTTLDKSQVRAIAARWNDEWAKARLAVDTAAFERLLPRGYFALMDGERMDREQFIAGISAPPPGVKVTRFDARILTVSEAADGWSVLVQEKLEIARTSPEGVTARTYHLWIIRDLWKPADGTLQLASGEVVSTEGWRGGTRPPFADW